MSIKRVVILGSTGSIGINTLKVIERFPDRFKVVGLTAFDNGKLLAEQVRRFVPRYAAVGPSGIRSLKKNAGRKVKVLNAASDELVDIVKSASVDIVVIGMRGSAALIPFLEAVRSGKTVAPANKEALVVAGEIIMREARKNRATIIPVDSEQSAIFQCLDGQRREHLKRIYLTASGGPLHNVARKHFARLSVRQILKHPRWKMGKKITVDSATLMNKGFEVIETKRLFGVGESDIKVVVHPEAVVHSMVEFRDGSILAQMGVPDMRLPIQYALTYPERLETGVKPADFYKLAQLTFDKPDMEKFPALRFAFEAARKGGTFPCVLNAADEEAVDAFLKGKISFPKITDIVGRVLRKHRNIADPRLKDIFNVDQWAREEARKIVLNGTP